MYGVLCGIVWRFVWYCMAYPILEAAFLGIPQPLLKYWFITNYDGQKRRAKAPEKTAICLYLCYLMYKHKYSRMLCVAHTPILYLFFLFPYGEKWGFKVEASPPNLLYFVRSCSVMILTNGEQMASRWGGRNFASLRIQNAACSWGVGVGRYDHNSPTNAGEHTYIHT